MYRRRSYGRSRRGSTSRIGRRRGRRGTFIRM